MIELLDPLVTQPGVILAALISDDGVPVAVPGKKVGGEGLEAGGVADSNALAAICAGWMDELTERVSLLSCDAPRRVVLRATRATLLLLRTSGAVLLVVLEPGLGPDELWLPMEGVAARIQRILRGMGDSAVAESMGDIEPPSPFPKEMDTTVTESPSVDLEVGQNGGSPQGN
ncbi:MAG: putative regulator of Ras-like GTPase activity (Roadblock/LC7/MglB family) [Planctomycetota bacterium]